MSLLNNIWCSSYRQRIICLFISFLAITASLFNFSFQYQSAIVDPAWIAIILCGIPIVKGAFTALFTHFDVKADLLVTIALIASIIINEIFAAGEIAFIMQLGSLLEELTVSHARSGIEKLIHLKPSMARIIHGQEEQMIPADHVNPGDILRVCPGETIPADGVIITGNTSINQSLITGESLPVDKGPDDPVTSGTINQFGSFCMQVTKAGEDSSIQKIIQLMQSADAGKAAVVRMADRWATWIVVGALSTSIFTWILTGEILRAVTILVVFCPCALVLATPTAIMAGIGNASKHGILIKEGDSLERLSHVRKVAFDKTGTLTYGKPHVIKIANFTNQLINHLNDSELFSLAASAELYSEHPLGKSVLMHYHSLFGHLPQSPESFTMLPGLGITAKIGTHTIHNGNQRLLNKMGLVIPEIVKKNAEEWTSIGCTIIYISIDNAVAGFIALQDILRTDISLMIQKVKKSRVCPVLLTGDHDAAAKYIAQLAGIEEYKSDCLPEDKLRAINYYEQSQYPVCMVGDGINDAPALKSAHVGIAMGGIGSDISTGASDMVFIRDDILYLPHLLSLSQKVMHTIRYNLTFSMGLNFLAVILAMYGILDPVSGALVHNTGSIFVILNSAHLLNWKEDIS
jgi:heavy metal translocating P-type ATPase